MVSDGSSTDNSKKVYTKKTEEQYTRDQLQSVKQKKGGNGSKQQKKGWNHVKDIK